MVSKVVDSLHIKTGSKIIDGTLGNAGHSSEMIKMDADVLGIEADPKMLAIARERVPSGKFVLGNFTDIKKIAEENGFSRVDGIVLDLGVTNLHLTGGDRGFSFTNSDFNSDLDMRLNPDVQGVRANDLLNALREDQLKELFGVVMDKGSVNWLVARILEQRPISTVGEFLEVCKGLKTKPGINSATLPFLALRIAVNSELENLKKVLPDAYDLLNINGVLAVITFHSAEDKIVKDFFKKYGGGELILPDKSEIEINKRSRSAKLRILKKHE